MKKSVSVRFFVPLVFSLQVFFFIPGLLLSQTVSLPASQQTTNPRTNPQVKLSGGAAEKLWQTEEGKWEQEMERNLHMSPAEFNKFLASRFRTFQKEKGRFFNQARTGIIRAENVNRFFDELKNSFAPLYAGFKNESQSNVPMDQHKPTVVQSTCNPSCDNIGFQDTSLNAWSAYYAINNSNVGVNLFNFSFHIDSLTGGPAGKVTKAAGPDPWIVPGDGTDSTYQVSIIKPGSGLDPIAGSFIPLTPPLGGNFARVGDGVNAGQGVGQLEQTFSVSASNPILTIQYAVLLESAGHSHFQQPFFSMVVLDQATGDTISTGCGNYSVVAGPGQPGFTPIFYPPTGDSIYCRPWTTVFLPLYKYVGKCVTVRFQAADCSPGAHLGYAYVACSCNSIGLVNSSSSVFCTGQKSVTLTGSPGVATYSWSTVSGCISGSSTQQVLHATCPGTYQVIETSSAGPNCIDTININIPASPNSVIPIPSFTATEACFGTSTQFTNTSNPGPGAGVTYYWDYYNSGQINDSTNASPAFNYPQPGNYQVVLHETVNGCGADTSILVKVDTVHSTYMIPNVAATTTSLCSCNGIVTVTVSGAGSAFTVKNNFNNDNIHGGGGLFNLFTSNFNDSLAFSTTGDTMAVTYTGLCPGTYKFFVHCRKPLPATKCSPAELGFDTLTVSITGSVITSATGIQISPSICNKSTGSAYVSATGSVSGLTYNWSNSTVKDTVVSLASATYTVTVTNSANCTRTATVSIKDLSIINPTLLQTPVLCFNGLTGSATITPTSGTAPFSYSWSTGVTSTGGTGSSSTDSGLPAGSYAVTITDAGGCSSTSAVTITQPSAALSVFAKNSPTGCATPDGVSALTASGGTQNYTYNWSTGSSSFMVGSLSAGTYTVTVTDLNGCSVVSNVAITKRPPPKVGLNPVKATCVQAGDSLCVQFFGSVPVKYASYLWNFGVGSGIGDTTSKSFNPTYCYKKAGNYSVTLSCKDTAGCSNDSTIIVDVKLKPWAYFIYNPYPAQEGVVTNLVNQSVNSDAWFWNFDDPKSGIDSTSIAKNPVHTFGDTGVYCVKLTSSLSTSGCSAVDVGCIHVVHTLCTLSDSIPNVFTPNEDHINDDFVVKSNGMQYVTCEIFDRWGIKVTDFNALTSKWNGKLGGGSPAPEGTYFYTISGTCINDKKLVAHGFVQLLR